MNAHQRRIARRLYERAFGNHVDYYMTVEVFQDGSMATTMSKAHPTHCEYCGVELDMQWDDDANCYRCSSCYKAVAVMCPLCGGEGHMPEADMEGDWINYSDEEIVTCRECNGMGWTADPSFQ